MINACLYLRGKGFISEAILAAQSIYTEQRFGKSSEWSHIIFIGSDGRYYESTVEIVWRRGHIVYGVRSIGRNKVNKLISKAERCECQKLDITHEQWEEVTRYARLSEEKGTLYGGFELFGTLWTIIRWRLAGKKKRAEILKEKNPFESHNTYCIAFVSECFLRAGMNYTDPNIDPSNLTVDEGAMNCMISSARYRVKIR